MCDNYIGAVNDVLSDNIPVIVDRFHVIQLCHKKLQTLRSSELNRIKKLITDKEYKALRPAIKILLSKHECYSTQDKKILAPLFKQSPAIKAAYRLARELTHIYNKQHRPATAERKLVAWIEKVNTSEVSCLNGFAKTIATYQKEISHYFIRRETSGWVEGINNKIKVIKRRCYGIINIKHFFQRIFLDLQGYDLLLPKQQLTMKC